MMNYIKIEMKLAPHGSATGVLMVLNCNYIVSNIKGGLKCVAICHPLDTFLPLSIDKNVFDIIYTKVHVRPMQCYI